MFQDVSELNASLLHYGFVEDERVRKYSLMITVCDILLHITIFILTEKHTSMNMFAYSLAVNKLAFQHHR